MNRHAAPDDSQLHPLRDSTHLLDDREALEQVYSEEGYLFLRGVLPADQVRRVRTELFAALAAQGFHQHGPEEAQVRVTRYEDVDQTRLHEAVDYRSMWTHPDSLAFFERLVGEPVWCFESCQIRCVPANEDWSLNPPHQDANYIGPNDDFRTVWTPLTPVDRSMGGVALAAGSHRDGLLPTEETERPRPDGSKGWSLLTIPSSAIRGRWVAAVHIEPGDVIVFSPYLAHGSLANRSPRAAVRFSMDTRIQPLRSPRGPSATLTSPELGTFVQQRGLESMKETLHPGGPD